MKSEHNHNEMPSPEEFWPEAKGLLDSHFAKRRKVFLLFGVSLVMIITTVGLVFNSKTKNPATTQLNKTKSKVEILLNEVDPINARVEKNIKTSKVTLITNKSDNLSDQPKSKNNQKKDNISKAYPENKNEEIAQLSRLQNNSINNTTNDVIHLSNATNKVTQITNKSDNLSDQLDIKKSHTKDHNSNSYPKNENQEIAVFSRVENDSFKDTINDVIHLSNATNKTEEPISAQALSLERTELPLFSKIPLLSYKMLEQKMDFNLNENKYQITNKDEDYFLNKNKIKYFIGAYTGMQSVSKQIKSDQTLTEYANIRNTSEKKINTIYLGVNFTIEKKGFMLQTGFDYNTIGEQNNYEAKSKQWLQNEEKVWDVYNKQIIKVDTVYYFGIVNYNQTLQNVKDSTLLTKSDSVFAYHTDSNIVKANGKTTINYIEIPLMIGYQFRFGKASIAPFAGFSVGYLTSTKGMYINKSITGIEAISSSELFNTFNFNYQLKLQLSYNLSDNLMLVLTPHFRSNMFSVSSKSSGINTKYSAFGTSFGLSYKL